MRPSRANGVQAWLIEEERSGIAPGACAATGPLVHIANTTPARIPIALQGSGLMQTDFGATNARIASSIRGFRSNRDSSCCPTIAAALSCVEMPEPCHQPRATAAEFLRQLRNPGASRPVRATYSV